MRTTIKIIGLISVFATFSQQAFADDWFMPTPLATTYSALAIGDTQLAWQEMLLALSLKSLDERLWVKAKQALISQSQCGKQLIGDLSFNQYRHIRIMIQKKTNLSQQGYQFKVSLDGAQKSSVIFLRDQQGRVWLSGNTSEPVQGYVELESDDYVYAPTPGFYQLTIDKVIFPLILSSNYEQPWVKVNRTNNTSPISIQAPETLISCQVTNMRWQWFDGKFSKIGNSQPTQFNRANLDMNGYGNVRLPTPSPKHAKWLSVLVSQSEYQGTVKVEYAQRLTLPVAFATEKIKDI